MRKTITCPAPRRRPRPELRLVVGPGRPTKEDVKFTDVRQHTAAFHQYERTIKLTPGQQAIYREALEGLPAPCCSDNTALTCCCPCNSARAWWGLAKHLVADLGYDAEETRAKVAEWFTLHQPLRLERHHLLQPHGCGKPFQQGGCAGMTAEQDRFLTRASTAEAWACAHGRAPPAPSDADHTVARSLTRLAHLSGGKYDCPLGPQLRYRI